MNDFTKENDPLTVLASIGALDDYKHVIVNMYGVDGNAFSILGAVNKQLRRAGAPKTVLDAFFHVATQGTYEDLLRTCKEVVTVVHIRPEMKRGSDAFGAFDLVGGVELSDR